MTSLVVIGPVEQRTISFSYCLEKQIFLGKQQILIYYRSLNLYLCKLHFFHFSDWLFLCRQHCFVYFACIQIYCGWKLAFAFQVSQLSHLSYFYLCLILSLRYTTLIHLYLKDSANIWLVENLGLMRKLFLLRHPNLMSLILFSLF